MVVGRMLRLAGHGEHDDASYVPKDTKRSKLGRDCLRTAEKELMEHGLASAALIEEWAGECRKTIDAALAQAGREDPPDPYRVNWSALSTPALAEGRFD